MAERIRVQAADGTWETLGVDRQPGLFPQGIAPTWNDGGPDGLTFTIARAPDLPQVDLEEFTPVEYQPDGERSTWAGFVLDTPGGDDELTVQCVGWQHHRDADTYRRLFVHEDLGAWQDVRSNAGADLAKYVTGWNVALGGIIGFGYTGPHPAAGGWFNGGVLLDLGEDMAVRRLSIDWERSAAWVGSSTCYLLVGNDLATVLAGGGATLVVSLSGAGGNAGTYTTPADVNGRYVLVFCDTNAVQDSAAWFRLIAVRLFGDAAYQTAGASIVTADKVIKDGRARLPLLSSDESLIAATTLNLRQFTVEDETFRSVCDRVNDYHGYRLKVDERRRVVFQPQADRAILAVDVAKPGARFKDTSKNSGRQVYNKVVVRGRSGAGDPLRVVRYSANIFPERAIPISSPAVTNPTFDATAANWVNLTRDTANPRSGAGAGLVDLASTSSTKEATGDLTGSDFLVGNAYRFDVWVRAVFPNNPGGINRVNVTLRVGVLDVDQAVATIPVAASGVYQRVSVVWIPRATATAATVKVGARVVRSMADRLALTSALIDDLALWRVIATSADRRGFLRSYTLDIAAPTDTIAMAALGDAFLRTHAFTPLSGELEITSDQAVRIAGSAAPVPMGDLGLYTGELVLLESLIDPDLGDLGRVGIIKAASKLGDRATVAIDNDRGSFQRLLARMGAVGGKA